jgi:hypothetical protein
LLRNVFTEDIDGILAFMMLDVTLVVSAVKLDVTETPELTEEHVSLESLFFSTRCCSVFDDEEEAL